VKAWSIQRHDQKNRQVLSVSPHDAQKLENNTLRVAYRRVSGGANHKKGRLLHNCRDLLTPPSASVGSSVTGMLLPCVHFHRASARRRRAARRAPKQYGLALGIKEEFEQKLFRGQTSVLYSFLALLFPDNGLLAETKNKSCFQGRLKKWRLVHSPNLN